LSSESLDLIYSSYVQNLTTVASAVTDILLGALKFKMGHNYMTLTDHASLRVIYHPYAGT